jgi:N utilization substance protein A
MLDGDWSSDVCSSDLEALDVDEVVAQLLATEGFGTVEELAYVGVDEIARIEGFDEETAEEIQNRANAWLEALEAAQDEERKALGVEDALRDVAGVTTAMMVALGKEGIKSVEDLAGCATDDLVGWTERKGGEVEKHAGTLDGLDLSRADAEAIIMAARVAAGWIEAPVEAEAAEEGEAERGDD